VLGAFIWWELRAEHPMLPLHFYRNRRFSAANGAITLTFFAMLGSMFLLTQFWQLVKGYTPLQVGYRMIPYALAMMFTAPRVAKIVEKFGTKAVMVTGLCTIAAAMIGLSFLDPTSSYPRAIANLMLLGVGIALSTVPATESIMGSLPPEKAGVGSAVNDTTRQVGAALGVAVIGSVVAARYTTVLTKSAAAAQLTAAQTAKAVSSLGNALSVAQELGARATAFVVSARDAFMQAFASGVRIGAVVVFAAAVVAFKYVPARATHTSAVHASHEPTPYDDADPASR
jgi:predicted MFS family arabinose efflux permease